MTLRPGASLDVLNARSAGSLPGLLGFRETAIEEGMLAAELDILPDLLAPNGFLHAATIIALADTACGFGCIAHLGSPTQLWDAVVTRKGDGKTIALFRCTQMVLWTK
ncbi:MAG: PaaI family thioesterase [Betaproteobacteria bacterium]